MSAAAVSPVLITQDTQQQTNQSLSLQQQIKLLAYSLWERRGRPENSADTDWFEAEEQIVVGTSNQRN
jgi:hypothetical protein